MNEQELTPWFPADVKPARDGVYQRDYGSVSLYCAYRRGKWRVFGYTPEAAAWEVAASNIEAPWRGLAKPAKEQ
ncbi:hypothetical protein [Cupriavidus gilardii]|uniref:Uncharacterized protein n=1 Tax=Cupriavidus gilardii TaxID=82541 RepID=A0A849BDS3_9BURK|nr:hypothetical protein [Cupriavidus gilardii]KAB0597758.1 hypothetical protein F7Q96_07500 [Cupriavidus gilardii]NNH14061.1 hypothetical protein [Cupriavidus gilardii]